jgi:hypothetical protein
MATRNVLSAIMLVNGGAFLSGNADDGSRKLPPTDDLRERAGLSEAERGRRTLRARATDAAGNVQPEVPIWNRLGYGNNAIEVVFVDVR